MKSGIWLAVVAGLTLVGCDSHPAEPSKPVPPPMPTTLPAAVAPHAATSSAVASAGEPSSDAIVAAAPQPASSQLTIDGQLLAFPAAKLRVSRSGSQVVANLYSDDPKDALKDNYQGNHYELLMELANVQDPHQIAMASWQHRGLSHDYANQPYGIFIQGMKYQLQPFEVSARFVGDMLTLRTDLEGTFLMFDSATRDNPRLVYVKGSLAAAVSYKE